MKIEIEKKYELTDHDVEIIEKNCNFIREEQLTDYYLDDTNFTLFTNDVHLRLRNGKYELKVEEYNTETHTARALEFDTDEEIEKFLQKKFQLSIDDTSGVIKIESQRKKYAYTHKNRTIHFDLDDYGYGSRYEIEILVDDDNKLNTEEIFQEIREALWLTALISLDGGKGYLTAMHQNIALFEILDAKLHKI